MTKGQLQLAWDLFQRASQMPARQQEAYLQESGADPLVVAEVLALLEQQESGDREDSPPDASPDRIGSQIGPFRITGFLGRGGMGEVYSAKDTTLGRMVALKLLPAGSSREGGSAIRQHIREAKAASSLNHPNIVSVYQVVESGSDTAIAMELVEGNSIRAISGKPMPLEHVCHFGRQAAQALAAAHRQGIIHRDIKPENLMVRPDGYLKVLDFGLAREIAADSWSVHSAIPLGTLRYMSPEQICNGPLTGATDVFSLGLVFYELATGRHPFAAESSLEAVHSICNAHAAAPSSLNSFLPVAFDELIFRMLQKSPSARPTAQDVVDALKRIAAHAEELSPPVVPASSKPEQPGPTLLPARPLPARKIPGWAAACAVAALVVFAAGTVAWRRTPAAANRSAPVARKPDSELVLAAGPDSPASRRYLYGIRPDGGLLVYVDDSGDDGGSAQWIAQAVSAPPLAGVNLAKFARVVAGGDGVLYGISEDGAVTYFRLLDPWRNQGPMRWSADSNTPIGKLTGQFTHLAAMSRPVWLAAEAGKERISHTSVSRGGLIWGVGGDGKTSLFQHGWTAQGAPAALMEAVTWYGDPVRAEQTPRWRGPALPGAVKCQECRLLEGGGGVFYSLSSDGILLRLRNRAEGGAFAKTTGSFARGEFAAQVGHGWQMFQTVVAEPGPYQIEGYVSTERSTSGGGKRASMSVEAGSLVNVRVSTFSPVYSVRILRLERRRSEGGGLIDGRPFAPPVKIEAPAGGNFKKAHHTGMHVSGAAWPGDGAGIRLPPDAPSGIYAAELTTPGGGRYLAPFIVKPPAQRHNRIAVIANANTWNAYNQWGGGSRFASAQPVSPGQPYELSYERPLLEAPWFGGANAAPGLTARAKLEFNQLVRAEVWITSTLDQFADLDRGYSFDVYSDVDFDEGIANLAGYPVLILQTRPEFWSDRMRDHLDAYLAAGGHLIYLGTHGLSERVSISESGRLQFRKGAGSGCIPEKSADAEQLAARCPALELFREPGGVWPDGRSERAVLGLAHELFGQPVDLASGGGHFVVAAPHPFLLADTGLRVGSKFGTVRGLNASLFAADGEINSHYSLGICPEYPGGSCGASHSTLAGKLVAYSSPNQGAAPITASSIVYRKTPAGSGWVFSIGSLSFGGALLVDPVLQRILRNALDSGLAQTAPPE